MAKSKSKHKKERKHTRTVFGRKTLKLHGGELELRYKGRKRVILRIPTRKTRKGKVKKLKSKRIAVEGEIWEVVDRKTGQTYRYVVNTVDFKRDAKRHALPPGKRCHMTPHGKKCYYEYRSNRSDIMGIDTPGGIISGKRKRETITIKVKRK